MSTAESRTGRLPLPLVILLIVVAFLAFRWFVGTAASMRAASVEVPASEHLRFDLPEGGVRSTLSQHSTAPLPGTDGVLEISLGDITAGQVRITLVDPGREVLMDRVSAREGDRVPFTYAGHAYAVEIVELDNRLVGNDVAIIGVLYAEGADGPTAVAAPPGEDADVVIEALLTAVAGADLVFIRNGDEHDPEAAAAHLRRKWSAVDDPITPEQFIDELASRSSMSGEPYSVRAPDGTVMASGAWLHARLAEIRASAADL